MAVELGGVLMGQLAGLRYQPTPKRVRASIGGRPVLDSSRAVLVWEPRRIVPAYAVPADDIPAELVAATAPDGEEAAALDGLGTRRVLSPGHFRTHTTEGEELTLRSPAG